MSKPTLQRDIFIFCALAIFGIACARWIDIHNVKPVAAVALFGGVVFGRKIFAVACPLLLLWIIVFGQNVAAWPVQCCVAGGLLFGAWAGRLIREQLHRDVRRQKVLSPAVKVAVASSLGSLIFFIVSNFGWWMFAGFYPPTLLGLVGCFLSGIPFLANTVLGDLCFNAVLFGAAACCVFQPIKSPIWMAFKAAPLRN